jgi:hypothetical protein
MKDQPKPPTHNDMPLLNNHHLMRNVRPTSLTSLDSGHATQYTQSITSSSHTANSRGGPMRATVRPRGITEHIPSTLCTVSSNNSATRTYSRHRSRTPSGGPYSDGDASQYHHDGSNISSGSSLARKRSQSMEALNTQKDGDSANRSCHSHSSIHTVSTGGRTTTTVLSARSNSNTVGRECSKRQASSYGGKLRAVYDCDKENESATMTRKPASESGSVSGGWQRGQVRPASGGSSCSAPFKDRTNRATVTTTDGNGQKSSSGISTTAVDKPKAKMLTDLAPPLNAARLKPIQQQTRTAKVS